MKKKSRYLFVLILFMHMCCKVIDTGWTNGSCNNDHIVSINEQEQEERINEAELQCMMDQLDQPEIELDQCGIVWDGVYCWPASKVNETVFRPCPNYLNKFNIREKAFKSCYSVANSSESKTKWSKTNYTNCTNSKPMVCPGICEIEDHMKYFIIIRVCGYVISGFSLFLSISILLKPKLRCPRNFVHINLFLAFSLRTILVMLVDSILNVGSPKFLSIDTNVTNSAELIKNVDKGYIACKIMVSIYRYSGSVYHMAVFSEAIYLVLLLKFPYYNELKGCKFCILITWTLPFLWNIPWIFVKAFVDNIWCWQTESYYNFINKIPHTILLVANIISATYIIRVLYSKIHSRNHAMSMEKLMKYRRLAKSTLILIPIFGLHFIFFAWLPYVQLRGDCFEISTIYFETFFDSFQGFVVAITCCFIHREVRIEFILSGVQFLDSMNCIKNLRCMNCLNSDYVRQLRYMSNERRNFSVVETPPHTVMRRERLSSNNEEENVMLSSNAPKRFSSLNRASTSNEPRFSIKHSPSIVSSTNRQNKCFSFLFGNRKNDFFYEPRVKKNGIRVNSLTRKSINKSNAKIANEEQQTHQNQDQQNSTLAQILNSNLNSNANLPTTKSSITNTTTTSNLD